LTVGGEGRDCGIVEMRAVSLFGPGEGVDGGTGDSMTGTAPDNRALTTGAGFCGSSLMKTETGGGVGWILASGTGSSFSTGTGPEVGGFAPAMGVVGAFATGNGGGRNGASARSSEMDGE